MNSSESRIKNIDKTSNSNINYNCNHSNRRECSYIYDKSSEYSSSKENINNINLGYNNKMEKDKNDNKMNMFTSKADVKNQNLFALRSNDLSNNYERRNDSILESRMKTKLSLRKNKIHETLKSSIRLNKRNNVETNDDYAIQEHIEESLLLSSSYFNFIYSNDTLETLKLKLINEEEYNKSNNSDNEAIKKSYIISREKKYYSISDIELIDHSIIKYIEFILNNFNTLINSATDTKNKNNRNINLIVTEALLYLLVLAKILNKYYTILAKLSSEEYKELSSKVIKTITQTHILMELNSNSDSCTENSIFSLEKFLSNKNIFYKSFSRIEAENLLLFYNSLIVINLILSDNYTSMFDINNKDNINNKSLISLMNVGDYLSYFHFYFEHLRNKYISNNNNLMRLPIGELTVSKKEELLHLNKTAYLNISNSIIKQIMVYLIYIVINNTCYDIYLNKHYYLTIEYIFKCFDTLKKEILYNYYNECTQNDITDNKGIHKQITYYYFPLLTKLIDVCLISNLNGSNYLAFPLEVYNEVFDLFCPHSDNSSFIHVDKIFFIFESLSSNINSEIHFIWDNGKERVVSASSVSKINNDISEYLVNENTVSILLQEINNLKQYSNCDESLLKENEVAFLTYKEIKSLAITTINNSTNSSYNTISFDIKNYYFKKFAQKLYYNKFQTLIKLKLSDNRLINNDVIMFNQSHKNFAIYIILIFLKHENSDVRRTIDLGLFIDLLVNSLIINIENLEKNETVPVLNLKQTCKVLDESYLDKYSKELQEIYSKTTSIKHLKYIINTLIELFEQRENNYYEIEYKRQFITLLGPFLVLRLFELLEIKGNNGEFELILSVIRLISEMSMFSLSRKVSDGNIHNIILDYYKNLVKRRALIDTFNVCKEILSDSSNLNTSSTVYSILKMINTITMDMNEFNIILVDDCLKSLVSIKECVMRNIENYDEDIQNQVIRLKKFLKFYVIDDGLFIN